MNISLRKILIYLVIINLFAFLVMWYDKNQAKAQKYRISEKALFLFCAFGGSIGGILGMYTFRHKTKKWYFKFGFPAILVLQIGIIIYLISNNIVTIGE